MHFSVTVFVSSPETIPPQESLHRVNHVFDQIRAQTGLSIVPLERSYINLETAPVAEVIPIPEYSPVGPSAKDHKWRYYEKLGHRIL